MTRADRGARLIVHADDFGLSEAVNRAVIAAHENGIVTAASLMAGGDAFEHAVALAGRSDARRRGTPHAHGATTARRGRAEPSRPGREVRAARVSVREALLARRHRTHPRPCRARRANPARGRPRLGAEPPRWPSARARAARHRAHRRGARRRYGIRAVRCPAERLRGYMLRTSAGEARRRAARARGLERAIAAAPARRGPLRGILFRRASRRAQPAHRARAPARAQDVELMCHPGFDDPTSRYGHWNYAWAAETAALSSPRIREMLDARGVRLIGYRDI